VSYKFQPMFKVSHELCRQYHVDLPLKMPYDHARRRYGLLIIIVRISEKLCFQLRGSKRYICCKLDMLVPYTSSHTVVILYRKLH